MSLLNAIPNKIAIKIVKYFIFKYGVLYCMLQFFNIDNNPTNNNELIGIKIFESMRGKCLHCDVNNNNNIFKIFRHA